jgi:hypothetical protein
LNVAGVVADFEIIEAKPALDAACRQPNMSKARSVVPVSVMPTPTTRASISTTSALMPRSRSAIARVTPPMPAPTIKTRFTAAILSSALRFGDIQYFIVQRAARVNCRK